MLLHRRRKQIKSVCIYVCVWGGGDLSEILISKIIKKNRKKEKENPFSPIPPYSWKGEGKRSAL